MDNNDKCKLAEGFSFFEKLWAQSSFFGMGIIGTIAIIQYNWLFAIPYAIVIWYGVPGVIMRHTNCPRCPHFHEFGDCLQAPLFFTKWVQKYDYEVKKNKPFSKIEKFLFYFIFATIPTYPIYFLVPNKALLVAFITCTAMWYSAQYFYFCKECRVKACPANRA